MIKSYLHSSLSEVESLLNHGGQLADPPAFLTEDILGAGGQDDDFCAGGGHTDLDSTVTILSQLTSEELVQLSLEDSIRHELKRQFPQKFQSLYQHSHMDRCLRDSH